MGSDVMRVPFLVVAIAWFATMAGANLATPLYAVYERESRPHRVAAARHPRTGEHKEGQSLFRNGRRGWQGAPAAAAGVGSEGGQASFRLVRVSVPAEIRTLRSCGRA